MKNASLCIKQNSSTKSNVFSEKIFVLNVLFLCSEHVGWHYDYAVGQPFKTIWTVDIYCKFSHKQLPHGKNNNFGGKKICPILLDFSTVNSTFKVVRAPPRPPTIKDKGGTLSIYMSLYIFLLAFVSGIIRLLKAEPEYKFCCICRDHVWYLSLWNPFYFGRCCMFPREQTMPYVP